MLIITNIVFMISCIEWPVATICSCICNLNFTSMLVAKLLLPKWTFLSIILYFFFSDSIEPMIDSVWKTSSSTVVQIGFLLLTCSHTTQLNLQDIETGNHHQAELVARWGDRYTLQYSVSYTVFVKKRKNMVPEPAVRCLVIGKAGKIFNFSV